jgi:tRNA uridine 5-carboxymethylaminomethyl modification enzyme
MFTSRAEHRLLLREDNADLRLSEIGHRVGAVAEADWQRARGKREEIARAIALLEGTTATPSADLNRRLVALGSAALRLPCPFAHILRRPELDLAAVWSLLDTALPLPSPDAAAQVEVGLKYSGYVDRQNDAIRRAARMEDARIPAALDYDAIPGLSREVRERLSTLRPHSLGQASRIAGITPAAVSLLSIHLRRLGAA